MTTRTKRNALFTAAGRLCLSMRAPGSIIFRDYLIRSGAAAIDIGGRRPLREAQQEVDMLRKLSVLALCTAIAACGATPPSGGSPHVPGADAQAAAVTELDAAARDCPWPADLGRYEQTTFAAGRHPPLTPVSTLLDELTSGCSVVKFAVEDNGAVGNVDVVSENPAGFGKVAADILRLNDYAVGASSLTVFMARVSGQKLPDGNAIVSVAFKDSVLNLEIPR
jgi:hypothetical protein